MQNENTSIQNKNQDDTILTITTLGSFSVNAGEQELSGASPRTGQLWKLFKYIISNRQSPIPTDKIVDVLWEGDNCDNPLKALYSLVYRLRNMLNSPFKNKQEFIIFQQNCYIWNHTAPYKLDVEEFEKLCAEAGKKTEDSEKLPLLDRAFQLYKGDYLAESLNERWVLPISNYYKRLYTSVVMELCRIYQQSNDYDSIIRVCEIAISLDQFEEEHHAALINALIQEGKLSQAAAHFDYISMILYKELGVHPSEKLLTLNKRIHQNTENVQSDLISIVESLTEQVRNLNGAFFCELDVFKRIFQLEQRTMERSGQSIYLAQFMVVSQTYAIPPTQVLNEVISLLKKIVLFGLRRGDVVTQYSKSQLLLMLNGTNDRNCEMVMVRLKRKFESTYKGEHIILKYSFEPLGMTHREYRD